MPNVAGFTFHPGVIIEGTHIYIGQNVTIEPGALIREPTIIGDNCKIIQGAYVRGNVVLGNGAVVGQILCSGRQVR